MKELFSDFGFDKEKDIIYFNVIFIEYMHIEWCILLCSVKIPR